MNQAYLLEYERFELSHWWFSARRRLLHQVLDQTPLHVRQGRWLDIGCGTGVLLDSYKGVPLERKVGAELDSASVWRARQKGLEVRQIDPSWELEPLGRFDVISACDVLEHLPDDDVAVERLWERLRPGGSLVVTVPALMCLWSGHDEVNHHFRRYRRRELLRLFPADQWEVERCSYFSSLLLPLIYVARKAKNLRQRMGQPSAHDFAFGPRWLDGLLERVFGLERYLLRYIRLPLGSSLLLVARKRQGRPAPAPRRSVAAAGRRPAWSH